MSLVYYHYHFFLLLQFVSRELSSSSIFAFHLKCHISFCFQIFVYNSYLVFQWSFLIFKIILQSLNCSGWGCGATDSMEDYDVRGPQFDSLLSGWLFMGKYLRMAFSGNQHLPSYKCILTYNQQCYFICLLYNCFHWFHFQLIKKYL